MIVAIPSHSTIGRSIQPTGVNRFQGVKEIHIPVEFPERSSGIDQMISDARSQLIDLRQSVLIQGIAPTGAFIFKKQTKKPNGKTYSYWFVRGYNPERELDEKSLGSAKRESKALLEYRNRIARRGQILAIDLRLVQLQNYLTTASLNVFPTATAEKKAADFKDDS